MRRPVFVIGLAVFLAAGQAAAAPGDLIANVNLPVTGVGVSAGADCNGNIYYTLTGTNNLYKMDKNGALLATIPVGFDFDELTWDNTRNLFWACLHGSTPVSVYTIDPVGPTVTFAFVSQTISVGTYRDGIAYDAGDDSIWISGDVSTTIEHYTTGGGLINVLTPTNAAGGQLGLISGVSVGVGDQLYLGRNGAVEIVRVQKSTGAFISSFASPGGARDEGLECDAFSFAPTLVLWSREFNSPGFMSVIELEAGTCLCGGTIGVEETTWGKVKNTYR